MNKIKVIYDAVRKMKDKESIKGTFKAEGLKDQNKLFDISSTFERSEQDGQVKGKTYIEADCDGKKMKMEKSIDFQGECCHRHDFLKHIHACHNRHHGAHSDGFKGGLSKITALLGILSSISIDENGDGSAILSLKSADISEDIKACIHEKMKCGHEYHKHIDDNDQCHALMKEFHGMDNKNFTLNVFIDKDNELDKITVDVKGEQEDDKGERHDMKLTVQLQFE